ncbi:glycosyltransferase [Sphingomonas morindae]|uniref:Glycosyltransferase n=1 Tax=Sphingomonas morindae TaxID=1541170 RepID=A0ABY4X6A1_9SPHN|nr:glycosyltransferase [Sphingomonas morindae]USI72360.1 glycosyltransferase [Sphingomonas morindae]
MKLLLDLQGAQTESRFRGIGRQTRSLARAIVSVASAHDVHILLNLSLTAGLSELIDEFEPLVGRGNIHLFDTCGPVAEREPNNLWRTRASEVVREAAIAAIAPDIVHVASLFEGFVDDAVTSLGCFDGGPATAVTLHDLIPLGDPKRYFLHETVRRHWLRRAQQLKRADLLLAVSHYSAAEASSLLHIEPERIAVMHAGVDPVFNAIPPDAGERATLTTRWGLDRAFILFVGAVDPRKNPELIFKAFARLPAALQERHLLVFAGRLFEEEIGQLKIAAARHGIHVSRLKFLQHVSDGDLILLYKSCAAFLFPSVYEGFGLPALEAMACGAPVLAARATSLIEVVRDDAYLIDPTDPTECADKLGRLLDDPAAAAAARAAGIARAAEFTWERSAEAALAALERLNASRQPQSARPLALRRKPTLAFVSPLPSDRSGVATYSAALLPELGRHFDIECIITGDTIVTDAWIQANYVIRDLAFFERNAAHYDHILYSIGNSHFHGHMLDLVQRYPGVVLLHDFFLSDLIEWLSTTGVAPAEEFLRALYLSHGLGALLFEQTHGRSAAINRYPCNRAVLEAANGVIVHSNWAIEQTRTLYSAALADNFALIPHLRAVPRVDRRTEARARLGVADDEVLVCSFGILTERKRSIDLINAWRASATGRSTHARLVFVGENSGGAYGERIDALVAETPNLSITGYAADEQYQDYLAAADLAVQIRTQSRGETSGTVLDCLANRVPLIVNAHGPMAELPDDIVFKLADSFSTEALAATIDNVIADPETAGAQSQRAVAFLKAEHAPARIGGLFKAALERFAAGRSWLHNRVAEQVSAIVAPAHPSPADFAALSRLVTQQWPRAAKRQILYDVTVLAEKDARTGIQRVVRSILMGLLESGDHDFAIEPIYIDGHGYRYARQWTTRALGLPAWVLPDAPVEYSPGDIFLAIDWVPDRLPDVETWLTRFSMRGGTVVIGVHDLLPFDLPQHFPDFMPQVTRRWFETALRVADKFLCVSRSVADDVVKFGSALLDNPNRSIDVDYFHNAADLTASLPTTGMPADGEAVLAALSAGPSFLMVGTVEPRKGHGQVLRGFEQLWRSGLNVRLVIVGKAGWMMDDFLAEIERHPEFNRRLFLLTGISDEFLEEVYKAATALIAASEGEGFGLPLIEAAYHHLPLIARDIPVFREVAGDHAFYFSGQQPQHVSAAIMAWLDLAAAGSAPDSDLVSVQTWARSTQQVLGSLTSRTSYSHIGKIRK